MPLIAHSGHWLVDLAYVSPVVGLLIWLGVTTLRERRQAARERAAKDPDA